MVFAILFTSSCCSLVKTAKWLTLDNSLFIASCLPILEASICFFVPQAFPKTDDTKPTTYASPIAEAKVKALGSILNFFAILPKPFLIGFMLKIAKPASIETCVAVLVSC